MGRYLLLAVRARCDSAMVLPEKYSAMYVEIDVGFWGENDQKTSLLVVQVASRRRVGVLDQRD